MPAEFPKHVEPCPFCGGLLELKYDPEDDASWLEHDDTTCIITTLCVEFDCVESWNRRAGTKEAGFTSGNKRSTARKPRPKFAKRKLRAA